ncbi:putative pentatricopeptide [Medicago truncatula]|uniref:PPR repeat protein n=1 Tax=Medicago truncatula TaxID=3880 RepID=A0A072TL94_MEDTR|nr:pentatricopeptide repeat-containing protein At1g06143 [Medicago truncatula]KEH18274.1 PPR repeat protein [Medicago truncatula]RHN39219.1 putative pentatricopeptide [Medicago truncatula]
MSIYPSLIYVCVRVNSLGRLSVVLADYCEKKSLNLHVDYEELSLRTKVLRGEKVERSVAAIAGKHFLTINNFMRAFNMVKHDEFVLALFNSVGFRGLAPDESTLDELISSACCSGLSVLSSAKCIHAVVVKHTFFNPTVKLSNSLMRMYFICGDIDAAIQLFHSLPEKNLGSWNRYLTGLAHSGFVVQWVKALDDMLLANFKPNPATFLAIFTACCHSVEVDLGMRFYKLMSKYDITPTLKHNGVIIDMLSRAGRFNMALDFIGKMGFPANDIISVQWCQVAQ